MWREIALEHVHVQEHGHGQEHEQGHEIALERGWGVRTRLEVRVSLRLAVRPGLGVGKRVLP